MSASYGDIPISFIILCIASSSYTIAFFCMPFSLQSRNQLALRLPSIATGRTNALANTQSSTPVGCNARNSLFIVGDSPCVTPSTSPLHSKSATRSSCFGYASSLVCGSISNSCDKPLFASMSTFRCSKSSTSFLSSSIRLSSRNKLLGNALSNTSTPPQCLLIQRFLPISLRSMRVASCSSTPSFA